jgi:predicted ATPase
MLKGLTLSGKWAKRVGAKRSRKFTFEPGVNLLVGPNGSGKSTVLQALMHKASSDKQNKNKEISIDFVSDSVGRLSIKMFDFEKQSPRTRPDFVSGGGMAFQVGSHFRSHGETNRDLVEGLVRSEEVDGALFLLDEPDQALDFEGIMELVEALKACKAIQTLVSVHHPGLVCDASFHGVEMVKGYRNTVRERLRAILEKP